MILALAVPGLLAGCGGGSIHPPSLAPRAEERQPIPPPLDAPSEPAAALDPDLAPAIAAIVARAEEGHRHFTEAQRAADAAAAGASGQAQGSDAWVAAQAALSALDAARGATAAAAAALDDLRRAPANATPANRGAIAAAAERVDALETQEADAFAAVSAKIG